MTARDFGSWLSGYYGAVPSGQRLDMWNYISRQTEPYLDALKVVLVRRFSSQYGKVPDIAVMESHRSEVYDTIKAPLALSAPVDPSERLIDFSVEKAMSEIRKRVGPRPTEGVTA